MGEGFGQPPGAAGGTVGTPGTAGDLAVVIPTQNRWDVLHRTLAALQAQTVHGFEVVVVVERGAHLPDWLAGAVRVVERTRPGVGAARNAGVAATDRPLILFLGDDTMPEPGLVARHVAVHRSHPDAQTGLLGSVRWHPEVARGRLQRWLDWSGTQFDYATIGGDEAGWGRLYSSNVSLKRALFERVGGFDEEFLFGYEDIDLGLRMHEQGLRLLYEPAAVTWHLHRYTWAGIERRFLLVGGGEYLMVRKHPGFVPHFLDKLLHRRRATGASAWPWLVDHVPERLRRARHGAQARADAWYSKRLAPFFVAGWLAAEELDVRGDLGVDGAFEAAARSRLAELRFFGQVAPLVGPGARIFATGCSATLRRELVESGYDVVVPAECAATGTGDGVEGVSPEEAFDVTLAFDADLAPRERALVEDAAGHSAVVAVAARREDPRGGELVRGRQVLRRAGFDDSAVVVYGRGRRSGRVRSLLERVLRGERAWLPPRLSGVVRQAKASGQMSAQR